MSFDIFESTAHNEAAPPGADFLVEFSSDSSPHSRAIAVYLLTRFDEEKARAAVIECTSDESALVRESAFHALAVRGRLDQDLVAQGLADSSPAVRQAAMGGIKGAAARAAALDGTRDFYATLDKSASLSVLTELEKLMLLRAVPMLRGLQADDLEALTTVAQERSLEPGDVLCREGEEGDELFLVLAGKLRAWREHEGELLILGTSEPGSCIGELAALGGGTRTATVDAQEATRVLVLTGDDFRSVLLRRPTVAEEIIEVLVDRLQQALQRTP